MGELISVDNIKKNFGAVEALKGVSLSVDEGEKVVVIGPSGSGKSVLIRCMNALERPDSGSLTVDGMDLMARKVDTRKLASEVAMVFQGYNLYPHKTVLENVTFAPEKVLKVPKAEAEENARKYLERVGLTSKLDKFPDQLSGGQQQRVAIARAIVNRPQVLLLDEPCSALDVKDSAVIEKMLLGLKERYTIVIVTHNIAQARRISDWTACLYSGRLVEFGESPAFFAAPQQEAARDFLSGAIG